MKKLKSKEKEEQGTKDNIEATVEAYLARMMEAKQPAKKAGSKDVLFLFAQSAAAQNLMTPKLNSILAQAKRTKDSNDSE